MIIQLKEAQLVLIRMKQVTMEFAYKIYSFYKNFYRKYKKNYNLFRLNQTKLI